MTSDLPFYTTHDRVFCPLVRCQALISEVAAALPSSSPPPSLLTPLSSPLPQNTSPPLPLPSPPLPLLAPSLPFLLPATNCRVDVPEADVPPQKRLCLTSPTLRFKVGESSVAIAARHLGVEVTHATDYGFIDTVDATPVRPMSREDTHETYVRFEDAQDDRSFLRAQINMIRRDRRYFNAMAVTFEREAMYAHGAWAGFEDRSAAIEANVRALEIQVVTLIAQTSSLHTRLTAALGRIQTLEAREPARTDDLEDADSSA
ncbi:hypothetical protein Tco_1291472 [Tanacetum coccineum]